MLTMSCIRTNLTQQVIEEIKNYFKEKVFETVIPRSVKLSEAPSFGKPAIHYDPQNRGSKGYRALGDEIIKRFGIKERVVSQEQTSTGNMKAEDQIVKSK